MTDRIDKLRIAIDAAVDDLNAAWGGFGPSEELERAITRLQHARTADDIANGRDWYPPAALEEPTP
jgi:hypothetical protein